MADGAAAVPPHRRLRAATADAHAATEAVPVMHALVEGRLDAHGYTALLQALYRLHRGWEWARRDWLARLPEQGWTYRSRADALADDLRALDASLPEADGIAALTAVPACWGELYVVEGSALGGQLIARQLTRSRPALPRAFFSLGAAEDRATWRHFLALLDRELAGPSALDAAIAGAQNMFSRFLTTFEGFPA